MSSSPAPLPALLPPPAADATTTDAVVDRALPMLHALLDELRAGPLARAGTTRHRVKADGTVVTPVDVEVDERITAAVAGCFDGHEVVSEELDAVATDAEWQWVVDPVDGTSNFTSGLPHWGVAIALCHGGVPLLGVVDAPELDARWVGVRGRGCERDGHAVAVRPTVGIADPHTAHLPFITSSGFLRRIRPRPRVRLNPRILGAAAVDAAYVADGTAVASALSKGRVWDVAAAGVLVEAAGGAACRLDEPLFPLVPGRDHTDLPAPAVYGPDLGFVSELVRRLLPADDQPQP